MAGPEHRVGGELDDAGRRGSEPGPHVGGDVLEPGEQIEQYTITGVIARGGGGTVYGAVHRSTGRAAAIKVLHAQLTQLPKMVERFQREVMALNLLKHPGIVEIWDVGTVEDGRPFFAMEHLSGLTVSKLLDQAGRLLPAEAIEILEPVCAALDAAHSAGIIHRDIKPSNIMVVSTAPSAIKLLDFGVAKLSGPAYGSSMLTSEGQILGTPGSMAPEQILGRPVDARTDIYALGVLLYRMLTGRPPFSAQGAFAQVRQHLEEPAPRPSLRAPAAVSLDPVVLRCMAKEPSQRYGSIAELLAALRTAEDEPLLIDEVTVEAADLGAAIHVEIRTKAAGADDGLADTVGFMLDAAEDALRDAGLLIGFATGNEVLAVQPLSADPNMALEDLTQVVFIATTLRKQLDARQRADRRVHANVCVHVDEVSLRMVPIIELAGGPLLRPDIWAPRADVPAVCGTEATMSRLAGRELPPGTGVIVPVPPGAANARPGG